MVKVGVCPRLGSAVTVRSTTIESQDQDRSEYGLAWGARIRREVVLVIFPDGVSLVKNRVRLEVSLAKLQNAEQGA